MSVKQRLISMYVPEMNMREARPPSNMQVSVVSVSALNYDWSLGERCIRIYLVAGSSAHRM